MLKRSSVLSAFCLAAIVLFAVSAARAQEKITTPDLSVAGLRLGSRQAMKEFLGNFQPTINEDGRPAYYFFNKSATQVLKLVAASFEDRFFLTEIEVYKVGKSYTRGHFQNEKIAYFKTESDIFVGYKQSKASAWTGIPNVDGKDRVGPKTVTKIFGEPAEKLSEAEGEILVYKIPEIELADETGKTAKFSYAARYEFGDEKLRKFVLKITPKAN
jgi:hypothetical protein